MAELTANGIRFNVVRLGPGDILPADAATSVGPRRPVVFLHGLIMDNLSSFYYTLAPAVAATTDTVLYDLRGHGRSERPLDGYRIEDGVDDLFAILDGLAITEPVHLVANSFGGTIALAAALSRPERIAGMVLIEAHPAFEGWGDEIVDDLSDLVAGFDGPGIRDYLAGEAPRSLRRMVRTCEELVTVSSMGTDLRVSRPDHARGRGRHRLSDAAAVRRELRHPRSRLRAGGRHRRFGAGGGGRLLPRPVDGEPPRGRASPPRLAGRQPAADRSRP